MDDDWDLQAVVRGCTTTTTATTAGATSAVSTSAGAATSVSSCYEESNHFYSFSDKSEGEEHDELHKFFLPKSENPPLLKPIPSFSVSKPNPPQKQPKESPPAGSVTGGSATNSAGNFQTCRSKRRKNQVKKVCQVPMEGLSSDVWSWRKYGQKPIKGSPYPRGYYRCSSSKGCLARKQVERNRSDPAMFIVTYTADHNHPVPRHRNSLAGSTRQKPLTPENASMEGQGSKTENRVEGEDLIEDDDEDEFMISDTGVTDDFFEGLEDFVAPVATGECFSDPFPANFSVPWVTNNAATAAGSD